MNLIEECRILIGILCTHLNFVVTCLKCLLSNIVIFFNFSGASSDKVTCWAYPGVFLGRIGQRRAREGRQGVLQGSNFNDGP